VVSDKPYALLGKLLNRKFIANTDKRHGFEDRKIIKKNIHGFED